MEFNSGFKGLKSFVPLRRNSTGQARYV